MEHDLETILGSPLPSGELSLEELTRHIHAAGLLYARAKARYERLDLFRASVKAKCIQRALAAQDGKVSEIRLAHLAEASDEYIAHLEELAVARREYEIARVQYESLRNLFEAKRSQLSFAKAEMSLL